MGPKQAQVSPQISHTDPFFTSLPAPTNKSPAVASPAQPHADAGEPAVYVATGTLVPPSQEQVAAIAGAMHAVEGARFIWSLPKACHPLLPSDMDAWAAGKALVLPWAPQQVCVGGCFGRMAGWVG
jgi:hypothetical protein